MTKYEKTKPRVEPAPQNAGGLEALLSALNQTALVSITDAKGFITYANDKFVEISKYDREELIGQNHRILKSGHQPASLFEDMWGTISQGKVWRGEIKNRAKDGSYYWVDTSIAPTLNEEGKPIQYIAVRFLVTEVKESSEKLKQQNKLLEESKIAMTNILDDLNIERDKFANTIAKDEALLKGIADAIVATDKSGKIILINAEFTKLLGWSEKEAIGKQLTELIKIVDKNDKEIPLDKRPAEIAIKTKEVQSATTNEHLQYICKDGTKKAISMKVSPIFKDNEIDGVIEVFRDVTNELAIDRAKSEFVSLASHQLRTPLTAINWYSDMLIGGDAGKLNEEQEKYVNEVRAGSQRMVDLVNALLNVSRIDLGTFMIEPEETDLIALCKKIVQDSEPSIFERKQSFEEKYPEKLEKLDIDTQLTRMVIENLVSNAIKYTPEKGTITLTIEQDDKDITIKVTDTGYGIPKSQQSKIFTKMFRADNVVAHDTEGTGLGLYIAKSVINAAGGKLWFESEENKGTTFFVSIPKSGMKAHSGSRRLDS